MQNPSNVPGKDFTPLMDLLSPFRTEPPRDSKVPARNGVYRNAAPGQNASAQSVPTQNVPTQTTPVQSIPPVTPQSNKNAAEKTVPFDEDRSEMDWYEKESDEEAKQAAKTAAKSLQITLTPETAKMGFVLSEVLGEPLSKKRRHGRWR